MFADSKIRVTAIQRLCVHDGPGVRTVIFLKGCYLRCPWCCNPEAIDYDDNRLYDKSICKKGENPIICRNCVLIKGKRKKEECPIHAFEKIYTDYNTEELFTLIMRDKNLFKAGGGITFSGGEPLFHAIQLFPLLQRLRSEGINVAIETSLYAPKNHFMLLKDLVNYWLVDLKFQYGYISNRTYDICWTDFESNLSNLQHNIDKSFICYRMVIPRNIIDCFEKAILELEKYEIHQIQLLAYHSLAKNKYKELKSTFNEFQTPTEQELINLCHSLKNRHINATYLSI